MKTATLRRVAATLTAAALTLGATVLSAAPAQAASVGMRYHLGAADIGGYTSKKATLGNGGTAKLHVEWSYDSYYGSFTKPHLHLQRKIGSAAWRSVKTVSFDSAAVIKVTLPAYKTSASSKVVKYRVASTPFSADATHAVLNTSYSKAITVTYENQAKYTGVKRQVWQAVKSYCPHTAVHIKSDLQGDEAGYYREPSLLITLSSIVGYYSAADRRTVALHECAHERQFVNWGETASGWHTMEKAVKKHFVNDAAPAGHAQEGNEASTTFDPVEHAADCAAYAVNPAGYLGYGGYCNAKELHYGKLLLTGYTFK